MLSEASDGLVQSRCLRAVNQLAQKPSWADSQLSIMS